MGDRPQQSKSGSGLDAGRLRPISILSIGDLHQRPALDVSGQAEWQKQDGYHHGDDAKRDNSMPPHVRRLAGLTGCRYGKRRLNFQLAVTITNTRS
jgi:hypothetical protein